MEVTQHDIVREPLPERCYDLIHACFVLEHLPERDAAHSGLDGKSLADVLTTSRSLTVARLLERDDFARRYRENLPITLMEFMYPMLQGMDSVAIDADIELGGTDQTYNNLAGRTLQKDAGKEPQIVMTLPLLRGTDGADKMGKSLGN
jgi:tyrosyl-tRNA synthetase